MKNYLQSSVVIATAFLSFASLFTLAQPIVQDSSRAARTQSISGTVTYDGSGAGTGGSNAAYFGYQSGAITTGTSNSFFGAYSGAANTTGDYGVFIGQKAGFANTSGWSNVFIGSNAGVTNNTGRLNVFIGGESGFFNTSGKTNTFLGIATGYSSTIGEANTFIGANAGFKNTTGSRNTYLGQTAGNNNQTGTGNVAIGYKAGYKELGSNKLYIANSDTINPLVYGDFALYNLVLNGKVGISTSTFPTTVGTANVSAYKLFVKGGILTDELRIRTGWADYVFRPDYYLQPLEEIETFIKKHGHLPNVPSAMKVETDGLSVGNIVRVQQEKIEELTLHLIDQAKRAEKIQRDIEELRILVNELRKNGK
jgi:hypothetical protein